MLELLKAEDVVMREALGRQPVEVIMTEIAVGNTVTQNVVGGHEDAGPREASSAPGRDRHYLHG